MASGMDPFVPEVTDAAIAKATGKDRAHWFAVQDSLDASLNHTARVRAFQEACPSVSGWWCQMLTVEWEKANGVRIEGQTSAGDFQVSCSKTIGATPEECFERVVSTPFLEGANWTEGATWETQAGSVEVRRADPGKMLRWFWHDADGKSTVEVSFVSVGSEKTTVVFRHHGLSSAGAREAYRQMWKQALQQIAQPS